MPTVSFAPLIIDRQNGGLAPRAASCYIWTMPFRESVKREAKERAYYQCVLCRVYGFLDVHHIEPEAEGGPNTIENAAPLCPNCHAWFGHAPAKRSQVRTIRDWWWDRCAKMDAVQMTPPDGQRIDQMFQAYQQSQAQEQEQLFNDMKNFVAEQFRHQADRISSAHTIGELVQASSSGSTAYGAGAYGAGPYGGTGSKCPSCGSDGYNATSGCPSCGATLPT